MQSFKSVGWYIGRSIGQPYHIDAIVLQNSRHSGGGAIRARLVNTTVQWKSSGPNHISILLY